MLERVGEQSGLAAYACVKRSPRWASDHPFGAFMLLKQLELQGYKTFATYASFDFDSGITAIVGPNGSGKSNVADAIRWVFGEQRQSHLRIKRIEDLIFAGSRQRPRQGMAEVSISLDNSAHWLPLDFAEVKITRRVYRSGESEFWVNGSRLRTRDLLELLEKGGIGRDAYVVVGQGLVDAALSLRPSERRGLIETAAGIRLYQAKKEESLNKLDETKVNLVRINDILNEIDLGLVLPYRYLVNILEMLEALDKLAPGVAARHTLLYGVEVKFYSSRLELDATLETNVRNLFAAGDGAGVTRGLVQASASGVVVARAILARG